MKKAIDETRRRRELQGEYNRKHGITPTSIKKEIRVGIERWRGAKELTERVVGEAEGDHELKSYLAYLYDRMMRASSMLDFERAARLRDEIKKIEREHGLERESKLKLLK